MIKLLLASVLLLQAVSASAEGKITYVGDGRYVCQGSDCDEFNRQQNFRNKISETRERLDRENRDYQEEVIRELKKRT